MIKPKGWDSLLKNEPREFLQKRFSKWKMENFHWRLDSSIHKHQTI